jgi:hypothetical protein
MKRAPNSRPAVPQEDEEKSERAALIQRARDNPHEFFSFAECGQILGFSSRSMGRLNAAGAPVAFRRMNPRLICQWIAENPTLVAKCGDGEE